MAILGLLAGATAWAQPPRGAQPDVPRMQARSAHALRMHAPEASTGRMEMRQTTRQQLRDDGAGTMALRDRVEGAFSANPFGLRALPLGTDVRVSLFEADPADGAEPVATLSLRVGSDSESTFLGQLAAALEDAAFARIETSERVVTLEGGDDAVTPGRGDFGARAVPCLACLEDGQTVTVEVYEAEDGEASRTLSFTQGVDSAIAFAEELRQAAAEADHLEVTLPATERTVDLSVQAVAVRDGPRFSPMMGWRW
ncbi:MAG: hypothetical protein U5K81_14935 [Trueperaceae bacterium]|nr:hypothetical protein [Trueperaceae bacterium]